MGLIHFPIKLPYLGAPEAYPGGMGCHLMEK